MFVEEKEVGEVKELDEAAKVLLKAADIIDRASLSYRVHPKRAEWNDAPERTKAEVVARMRTKALAG